MLGSCLEKETGKQALFENRLAEELNVFRESLETPKYNRTA
jgi:hypothetical protein